MNLPNLSRRVLIVSPAFPPINTPDLQRARMSLPYYRLFGWRPVVLTVDPNLQDATREEALAATVPNDVPIYRCGALSLKLSRKFGLGNLGIRAWFHLLFAGRDVIKREKIDLVFFSNTQFLTFLLGRIWRAWLGVPYVIDLHDPWRTDYYERPGSRKPPGGWKYQLARIQAAIFEKWAYRRLAGFMSVSQFYLEELNTRYWFFRRVPAATIRFGASEDDLDAARLLSNTATRAPFLDHGIRLVNTGAAGPIMPHSLRVLFCGLQLFKQRNPQGAARLRFEFLGTSYAPRGKAHPSVMPIAQEFGVSDQVYELAHRIGHLECLQIQEQADALLLLGSSDLAYSPSKTYPYFLANRPILAVVFKDSYLEAILNELSCATIASYREEEAKDEAYQTLWKFFEAALEGFPPATQPVRNEALFRREYLAQTLTGKQCALFNRALKYDDPRHGVRANPSKVAKRAVQDRTELTPV